jgi:hypothetical protein
LDRFKQYQVISESNFNWLSDEPITLNSDLVEYVTGPSNLLPTLGASLSFINNDTINTGGLEFEGSRVNKRQKKAPDKHFIFIFKRSLSLGGKTPFGIDCSGFTQMVYKLNGYKLLRSQQATGRSFEFY